MKYTTSIIIETDDGKYKLCALFYYNENKYAAPWIEIKGCDHIDNDRYIINTLLPFLKKKYDEMECPDDKKQLKSDFPKDRRKEVKGIIKEGIKLGFFKDITDED